MTKQERRVVRELVDDSVKLAVLRTTYKIMRKADSANDLDELRTYIHSLLDEIIKDEA